MQIWKRNEGYGMVQLSEKKDNVKNSPCDLAVTLGKLDNGGVCVEKSGGWEATKTRWQGTGSPSVVNTANPPPQPTPQQR